ncbi:GmrSD restriction endonuclease domain-containing protein [Paraclostridium bifermentans]
MSNKYEVNNSSVESILAWIKQGEIAIPEIQRPFVWDASKVRDLIDSLYKGYPVGYIITWKNPDVKLKDGTLASGKKVLIDGQQRITALTAAIVGQEVIGSNYKKKRIKIAFNPLEEVFEVSNPAIQKNSQWIDDISTIFRSDFSIWSFMPQYCSSNNIEHSQSDKVGKAIDRLLQIKNSRLGIIDLSHNLDIEVVTEIFIRINSKGVVLSQADFVMSKISSNEVYGGDVIRKTIDYFCHLAQNPVDFEDIKSNDIDFVNTYNFNAIKWIAKVNEELYVPSYTDLLRVAFTSKFSRGKLSDLVSLLSGRDFETREYKDEIAKESFDRLHKGVLSFVNETNFKRYIMIVKSAGIVDSSLIRSQNVLNFGYILYLTLKDRGIVASKIENIVRRWIVLSILTGRYSSSPESAFDYDIKKFNESEDIEAFVKNVEDGELSDAFWSNSLVTKLNTSVSSSPYFKVFLISQIKMGYKGFLSKDIDVRTLIEQRGDVHHIFPKNYLQNNGVNNKGQYNQIANYTYMQSEINIKIKDKSPKVYFNELKDQCEKGNLVYGNIESMDSLKENLKQSAIPEDIFDMDAKDYQLFLTKRRTLMANEIKKYYKSLI